MLLAIPVLGPVVLPVAAKGKINTIQVILS
jgi:hypothetical protein